MFDGIHGESWVRFQDRKLAYTSSYRAFLWSGGWNVVNLYISANFEIWVISGDEFILTVLLRLPPLEKPESPWLKTPCLGSTPRQGNRVVLQYFFLQSTKITWLILIYKLQRRRREQTKYAYLYGPKLWWDMFLHRVWDEVLSLESYWSVSDWMDSGWKFHEIN